MFELPRNGVLRFAWLCPYRYRREIREGFRQPVTVVDPLQPTAIHTTESLLHATPALKRRAIFSVPSGPPSAPLTA